MTKRNPALVIIFSIITCGIYMLYWMYRTTEEIEANLAHSDGRCRSGGMMILLSIVTCGIYTFYWWYCEGARLRQVGIDHGVNIEDRSVLYLILSIVALSIINTILIQCDINAIVDNPQRMNNGY